MSLQSHAHVGGEPTTTITITGISGKPSRPCGRGADVFHAGKKITKTQAIRERRASHPSETQQQTADAVGCSRQMVTKIERELATKSSQSEQKVAVPDWVTNPNQQAAFRKLHAEERARLEALPDDKRRGAA